MFKRKLYEKMLTWKSESNGASALMIEGARRVGKTTLLAHASHALPAEVHDRSQHARARAGQTFSGIGHLRATRKALTYYHH